MVTRLRILGFALSLTLLVCSAQHEESNSTVKSKCGEGMFLCEKESVCIPMAWLNDNENDCENGADEQNAGPSVPRSSSTKNPNDKIKLPTIDNDSPSVDDPSLPNSEADGCTNEAQQRVDTCANDLDMWIQDFALTNYTEISLLGDELTFAKLEQGCSLLADYETCTDGQPASCRPINPDIHEFQMAQMYACELLVPSVKEHLSCFSAARHQDCSVQLPNAPNTPVCTLIASVRSDLNCLTKNQPTTCDGSAAELFEPVLTETHHVYGDLECAKDDAPIESPTTVNEKPTPIEEPVEHEVEEVKPSAEQVKPTISIPSPPTNTSSAGAKIIDPALSNPLYAFSNLETICSQVNNEDIWLAVRKRVCARKDDLQPHVNCFVESAKRESKCNNQPTKNTTCAAVDVFNKNIDCIIATLSEVCPIEAQDVVVAVQESLNDDAIAHKCYEEKDTSKTAPASNSESNDEFRLNPQNPRCTGEQEDQALVCLTELLEINKKLGQLQNTNFLLEVSDENSQIVNPICALYAKYDHCLMERVFAKREGKRCAFNSPLNTLARIGLSPICEEGTRKLIVANQNCFRNVTKFPAAAQCQSGLQHLGRAVELMLQGIHGEALLCKSFYLLRDTFNCGEVLIKEHCEPHVLDDLSGLKEKMNGLGTEEGCPTNQPADLDEIIARPVSHSTSQNIAAPTARPLSTQSQPTVSLAPTCEAEEQKRFSECVQPLTVFQPHPLAVIKQPKEIDKACAAYRTFNLCRESIRCNPLWARGMSAMFEYACGDGYERFNTVRQCVRRTTTRDDIRECVSAFSKGAPQQACESSSRLLSCALAPISEKCGANATEFVKEYVRRFATTIDPQCKVGETPGVKAITTHNCTAAEDQFVQHCSAPLNDISARLEELFHGGLQSLLKNLNSLAPVFAEGCNLTQEFRQCAGSILDSEGPCVVSSCLIRAGNGICNQPDVAAAIDTNLGCIFKQVVSDPEFGRCLRTTISTLKQFNLAALRGVLPQFVSCIEPIVINKCGATPLNVLRALGSDDICMVSSQVEPAFELPTSTEPPTCTDERKSQYNNCSSLFFTKYAFKPTVFIDKSIPIEKICADISDYQQCYEKYGVCEEDSSLRQLVQQLCTTQQTFEKHRECLAEISESSKGQECAKELRLERTERCTSLATMSDCVAESINTKCGNEALSFSVDALNEYAQDSDVVCKISAPSVSLQTGCNEQDLVQYLECESFVDKFRFRPIVFISNESRWDEFCSVITNDYRMCLEKLSCRFEPVSTASLTLFENLCEREITKRDQRKHAACLSNMTESSKGKECLEPFNGIDLLAKDAPVQICSTINQILECSSDSIAKMCGDEALLHVYDIHGTWVRAFNSTCVLEPPTSSSIGTTSSMTEKTETTTIETTQSSTTTTEPSTKLSTTAPSTTTPASGACGRSFGIFSLIVLFTQFFI
ncbi:hypothetical protein M3Y95_00106400 [Aphelenchoides besseyi]|nr:hypothetical protein M3Y95_00106400 [Aphelenchoides besseyi]